MPRQIESHASCCECHGGVFARRLRVSMRTLENWEQGPAKPNAEAAALILMVRKYPDTFNRLRQLDDLAA